MLNLDGIGRKQCLETTYCYRKSQDIRGLAKESPAYIRLLFIRRMNIKLKHVQVRCGNAILKAMSNANGTPDRL